MPLLVLATALLLAASVRAESPAQFCARVGNDDVLRDVPDSLAASVQAIFHLNDADDAKTFVNFRCMSGKVMACNTGANLPCTKANISRTIPAVTQYCRMHPGDSVPASVAGHDSIYDWSCEGSLARPSKQAWRVDSRGFIADVWRQVP